MPSYDIAASHAINPNYRDDFNKRMEELEALYAERKAEGKKDGKTDG